MNSAIAMPPQQIRSSLHERIDQLRDEELEQMQRQMDILELKLRLDKLCSDYSTDWQAGLVTQKMVDDSIFAYRATHPYQSPGSP